MNIFYTRNCFAFFAISYLNTVAEVVCSFRIKNVLPTTATLLITWVIEAPENYLWTCDDQIRRGFCRKSPQLKIDQQKIDQLEIESAKYRSVKSRLSAKVDDVVILSTMQMRRWGEIIRF